ncbi:MAG: metallophosphoesterase [Oceanospirillaceae bacterium]
MNSTLNLLQITDCHLQQYPDQAYKNHYPDQRLDAVIAHVQATQSHSQHLLLSGDIAHYSSSAVYQRILDKTQSLAEQIHWLPGNHDDAQVMYEFVHMQRKIIINGDWAIVLLDSTANPDGVGSGSLSDEELSLLAKLGSLDVSHILIVLHHPPINVGSLWQDAIKLANSDEFWVRVKKLSKVRAISFGHLHQEHHLTEFGIELFCTPATAPQFKKEQLTPVLESDPILAAPAYRTLQLHADGSINSQVHRVL